MENGTPVVALFLIVIAALVYNFIMTHHEIAQDLRTTVDTQRQLIETQKQLIDIRETQNKYLETLCKFLINSPKPDTPLRIENAPF